MWGCRQQIIRAFERGENHQVQRAIGGYDLRVWGSKVGRRVTLASGGDSAAVYSPLSTPTRAQPLQATGPPPLANETGLSGQASLPGISFKNSSGLVLSCLTSPAAELRQSSRGAESDPDGSRARKTHSFILTTWHVGLVPDQG